MKFLVVDAYYPAFVHGFFSQQPALARRPYDEQWRALMDQCFGTADFYSANLQKLGHEATEIVANCRQLQLQWAREQDMALRRTFWRRVHGVPVPRLDRDWLYPVLLAQIKAYRPDVIHLQDPGATPAAFLREIRPYVRLITGQIASPIPPHADFRPYDLMLSSFPHFVQRFRRLGLRSAYFRLGFEPRVLQHLERTETHEVVFVGGVSPLHKERIQFLEQVARQVPVEWWGYGADKLSPGSPLRASFHGTAWALDMYQRLHDARIALNHHISVAENYANNMRLYEATGVGSLLLTDDKDNLHCLFEPGKEIVAYRTAQECIELINYYLEHEDTRQAIALAGQQRTLREHTYYHRMQELVDLVKPLLA